jgi:hypothetical protein
MSPSRSLFTQFLKIFSLLLYPLVLVVSLPASPPAVLFMYNCIYIPPLPCIVAPDYATTWMKQRNLSLYHAPATARTFLFIYRYYPHYVLIYSLSISCCIEIVLIIITQHISIVSYVKGDNYCYQHCFAPWKVYCERFHSIH